MKALSRLRAGATTLFSGLLILAKGFIDAGTILAISFMSGAGAFYLYSIHYNSIYASLFAGWVIASSVGFLYGRVSYRSRKYQKMKKKKVEGNSVLDL